MQISSVTVEIILLLLDEHESPGPDRLHPEMFDKLLAPFIAEPLAHLFNLYLATGHVSNDWRIPKT